MLYVEIEGKKDYIDPEVAKRWGLKAGQKTVMGYEIKDDPTVTGTMADYQPITPMG